MTIVEVNDYLRMHINRFSVKEESHLHIRTSPSPNAISLMNFATGSGYAEFCNSPKLPLGTNRGIALNLSCSVGNFTFLPGSLILSFGLVVVRDKLHHFVSPELESKLVAMLTAETALESFPVSNALQDISRLAFQTTLQGSLYKSFLEGIALAYLAEAGEHLLSPSDHRMQSNKPNKNEKIILDNFRHGLKNSPLTPPDITATADNLGITVRRLNTLFRSTYGQTVFETIRDARLELARVLLAETDLSLKAISEQAGYNHISNFTSAFRNAYHSPPRAYRVRQRKQKDWENH